MKKLIFALILVGVMSAGLLIQSFGGVRSAYSISNVLRAHGVSAESASTRYTAVGSNVMAYEGSSDGKHHNLFAQDFALAIDGERQRFDTVNVAGQVSDSYRFEGAAYSHSLEGVKEPINATNQVGDLDSELALKHVRIFGLMPFLRQLADQRTVATYASRTAAGYDKVKVQTGTGNWTFFSDDSGLIQKIEIGEATILFSDYRPVKGVQLPFNERIYKGQRLIYELGFIRIDPSPATDIDFFNQPDLFKQVDR